MNNQPTIDKMMQMKLYGMARAFQGMIESSRRNKFTADEIIGYLIDAEWDDRQNRRKDRLIKNAKFRYNVLFEEINFELNRNLDKNQMLRFSDCNWIKKGENIIITGPTGIGKSFIVSAFGHQACMFGYKVLYANCMKLFSNLKYAYADGSYNKEIEKIQKIDLLILDDFGLQVLDRQNRLSLLEIIEDRHGKKSTLIVSQLPLSSWHEVIGDATIADAICDRIIHTAHRIELKGESLRKVKSKINQKKERAVD